MHPGDEKNIRNGFKSIKSDQTYEKRYKILFKNLFVDNSLSFKILKRISFELYNLLMGEGYNFTLNSYK